MRTAALLLSLVLGAAVCSSTQAPPELAITTPFDGRPQVIVALGTLALVDDCLLLEQADGSQLGLGFDNNAQWEPTNELLTYRSDDDHNQFQTGTLVAVGGAGSPQPSTNFTWLNEHNCSSNLLYVHARTIGTTSQALVDLFDN